MGIEVDVGGVTDQQVAAGFGLSGLFPVRRRDGLECDFGSIEKPVSSLEIRPIGVLLWERSVRLGKHVFWR